jgi:DeoR/GlpR family transcriptional regulator of sugar metabolism
VFLETDVLAEERRRHILEQLNRFGTAKVADLVEQFGVSEMTIHRDLNQMVKEGIIDKVHGGAVAKHVTEIPYRERFVQHQAEKQAVTKRAAGLVKAGQTIFLSAGTTMTELSRVLPKNGLKIITNSLPIAQELTLSSENDIMLTGGTVRRYAEALVGSAAKSTLENEYIHLAFISVTGIDLEQGLSVYSESEADFLRQLIKTARKTVLVTDSSKYARVMGPIVLPLDSVHILITDDKIPQPYREYCQANDIDLITVAVKDTTKNKKELTYA